MLPTSVVILCWCILANSSWRNCLSWPRLWFGVNRTHTALPNWSRRCPMASSCLSVLHWSSGSESMFMQTNYDGLVWETGILDINSDRDSVVSFCGFFSGTTILGTIFDIPGISVPGHQPGNRWFVHTESQWHKVPDWTMPMALALSRLLNRTISWLNTWPIDHGPDRISILKLTLTLTLTQMAITQWYMTCPD